MGVPNSSGEEHDTVTAALMDTFQFTPGTSVVKKCQ